MAPDMVAAEFADDRSGLGLSDCSVSPTSHGWHPTPRLEDFSGGPRQAPQVNHGTAFPLVSSPMGIHRGQCIVYQLWDHTFGNQLRADSYDCFRTAMQTGYRDSFAHGCAHYGHKSSSCMDIDLTAYTIHGMKVTPVFWGSQRHTMDAMG